MFRIDDFLYGTDPDLGISYPDVQIRQIRHRILLSR
jgi:hypothetical protein